MTLPFPMRPLLVFALIFYLNMLSRIVMAPLLPVIENGFHLGHGEAGALFLFVALGYCTGLFGSGFVSSRLNHRRTILLSVLVLGGAMLATSEAPSVHSMCVGLLLVGLSAGLYLPSGIAAIADLVSREHWGKAMGIHLMGANLSFITAPFLVESLLRLVSWRGILGILGTWSILAGILFFLFGQGGSQKGASPNPSAIQKILATPPFWIMALVSVLSNGLSIGVYAMLPLFLVNEIGFHRELANAVAGFSRCFGVVTLLLSGFLTDRMGPKRTIALVLAITGVLTLILGVFHGPFATPILVFLQAASVVCLFPPVDAMLLRIFPSRLRNLSVSMAGLIGFLFGAGTIPPLIGYLAEAISFSFGFTILAITALAVLPVLRHLSGYSQEHG